MKKKHLFFVALAICSLTTWGKGKVYDMASYGIIPSKSTNNSPLIQKALRQIKESAIADESIILNFTAGEYHFFPTGSAEKEYYISNHDQTNPKKVGLPLEDWKNLTIEGNGAEFIFHGQMLPLSLLRSSNCTLQNFSIDFTNPHIAQVQIVKNEGKDGITFRIEPWVQYRISTDSVFES